MDQLLTMDTLSIAELRKILSDNDIHDTSTSIEELQGIVSETLLTKMMINQFQEESEKEYTESVELTQSMERSRLDKEQLDRRELLLKQEIEYEEGVKQDLLDVKSNTDEPLSPNSIRQKRLEYFNK